MRAAVCHEFGRPLVMEEIKMRDPHAGEVKVKVAVTALCHSDIHDSSASTRRSSRRPRAKPCAT